MARAARAAILARRRGATPALAARRARSVLAAIAVLMAAPAVAAELTPIAAYTMASERGRIADAEIVGDLDLSRLQSPGSLPGVDLINVTVRGRVFARGLGPPVSVRFRDSTLTVIDAAGARFQRGLELDRTRVSEHADFEGTTFSGPLRLIGAELAGKAVFRRATFEQRVEIIDSRFVEPPGLRGGSSFAEATFKGPARFDGSTFTTSARFDSAIFESDATFLKLDVAGTASFRNVRFLRDAEFRFCQVGRADFGDYEQMSAFLALADFRGCRMGSARFDYTEFRGTATFVNAIVGPGDLSFKNASFRGTDSDLAGLRVDGALRLDRANFAKLRLRWADVGEAIRRGEPDASVLAFLHKRLQELGEEDDARDVSYVLATARMRERVRSRSTEWPEKSWAVAQWAVWGLPTGYGTKLGRIVLIALGCWLVLAAPLTRPKGLLVSLPAGAPAPDPRTARPYHPMPTGDSGAYSDVSPRARAAEAFRYAFALMFKVPGNRLRPVDPLASRWGWYLELLWWVGSLLLALVAITLANTSPAVQAILGKLF